MAQPLTVLFMPESAYGPTNNCIGIGDVLRRRGGLPRRMAQIGAEIRAKDSVSRAAEAIEAVGAGAVAGVAGDR